MIAEPIQPRTVTINPTSLLAEVKRAQYLTRMLLEPSVEDRPRIIREVIKILGSVGTTLCIAAEPEADK